MNSLGESKLKLLIDKVENNYTPPNEGRATTKQYVISYSNNSTETSQKNDKREEEVREVQDILLQSLYIIESALRVEHRQAAGIHSLYTMRKRYLEI